MNGYCNREVLLRDKMKVIYHIKERFKGFIEMHYKLNMRQIMLKTGPIKIKIRMSQQILPLQIF